MKMVSLKHVPGLLPSFVEAYRQQILDSATPLTESQMFELVLKHFDLNLLFEAILKCQYGTPFYLHRQEMPILSYQDKMYDSNLVTKKYFLSVAVPIYRDRYLIVKSKKLMPILEEDTKENSETTGPCMKECGVKDEEPFPKEDSGFSFEEGGPILEQVVFSNPIPESAPHPIPLGTPSYVAPF